MATAVCERIVVIQIAALVVLLRVRIESVVNFKCLLHVTMKL